MSEDLNRDELALAKVSSDTTLAKRQITTQMIAVLAIASIVVAMTVTTYLLISEGKEPPGFYSTTISIAITGMVGLLSFQAGKASETGKKS